MLVDIFSFWDYPVGLWGLRTYFYIIGSFFYLRVILYLLHWYTPTNFDSVIRGRVGLFVKRVRKGGVKHILGVRGVLISLVFFTAMYVFGIFSPWAYPLGVHTVFITGISFRVWLIGVFCGAVIEDFLYFGHFCLPGDGLNLRGLISDIEIIRKFLQWITIRLRLRLNIIVGTFIIIGVFSLIGGIEKILWFRFWKKISIFPFLKLIFACFLGGFALIYEVIIIRLQIFLYFFLWQFYLKDNFCNYFFSRKKD